MPFEQNPDLTTPPDDGIIWRYMDLPKLLLLIEQRSLYFALPRELHDSWEAVVPRRTIESIAQFCGPATSGDMVSAHRRIKDLVGVNCWYQDVGESVAMWSLYTKEEYGTAIKSSVARLKQSFDKTKDIVMLGTVLYEDHDTKHSELLAAHELNALKSLLQKRPCYRHENELRALTIIELDWADLCQETSYVVPLPSTGVHLNVELDILIDSITLSPAFPEWAVPLLLSSLARAKVSPIVNRSALGQPPPQ